MRSNYVTALLSKNICLLSYIMVNSITKDFPFNKEFDLVNDISFSILITTKQDFFLRKLSKFYVMRYLLHI